MIELINKEIIHDNIKNRVEIILRWFKTPTKEELYDLVEWLSATIKPTVQELIEFENYVKNTREQKAVNRPGFQDFKRFLKKNRPDLHPLLDERTECTLKLCDNTGYLFVKDKNNPVYNNFIFRCPCNLKKTKYIPTWSQEFDNEYKLINEVD